jgi:hypothetical protein
MLLELSNFTAVLADVVSQFGLLWSHDLQNDTGLRLGFVDGRENCRQIPR